MNVMLNATQTIGKKRKQNVYNTFYSCSDENVCSEHLESDVTLVVVVGAAFYDVYAHTLRFIMC